MVFNAKLIAIFGMLSTGALANDVFTIFYTADYQQVGSVNYDVGNPACFQNSGATQIQFSQDKTQGDPTAYGPYCLSSYTASDCSGVTVGHQTFEKVNAGGTLSGEFYQLHSDVASAPYHSWHTVAC